jgi:hypothetical protein
VLHCVGLYVNRDACSSVTMYTYCVTVYIYERRIAYMRTLQHIIFMLLLQLHGKCVMTPSVRHDGVYIRHDIYIYVRHCH